MEGQVYVTLLLDDLYLPGALVLAHSLRDSQTIKKLAVLVTLDSVTAKAIDQLKTLYHYVVPVPRLSNDQSANLCLMDRPDLHSAFTKIHLWRQTQFSKVVYIDADVVAYRAPDELFSIHHAFSAAPDVGWPDIFNTGVMVLTPNMSDFYAMLAMAQRAISFDGADQGLLNMHFGNSFNRLPFIYNVTPSAHYQYLPAYRHFQSSIVLAHFIGPVKPWFYHRHSSFANCALDEMTGRWWAVHDRHYRAHDSILHQQSPLQQLHGLASGRGNGLGNGSGKTRSDAHTTLGVSLMSDAATQDCDTLPLKAAIIHLKPSVTNMPKSHGIVEPSSHAQLPSMGQPLEPHPVLPMSAWDAQRQPPPLLSKPEAINLPLAHYDMSSDITPFIPPARYPSPPDNMWYQIPDKASGSRSYGPRQMFPWEKDRPRSARTFTDELLQSSPAATAQTATEDMTDAFWSVKGEKCMQQTPTRPTVRILPSAMRASSSRVNAWDESPEIAHYMEQLHLHQGKRNGPTNGGIESAPDSRNSGQRRSQAPGLKLTDFPSQVERPSLPVTPAPIHRSSYWPGEHDGRPGPQNVGVLGGASLPAAKGVPPQPEWVCVHGRRWSPADCPCSLTDKHQLGKDPTEQLQRLARLQSEVLVQKLGEREQTPLGSAQNRLDQSTKEVELMPETAPTLDDNLAEAQSPTSVDDAS